MSKRDEFIELLNTFKNVSPTITDIQRRGLLRQAVQNYELAVEEATEILKSLGLVVGEEINYFEVLDLSIENIQGLDEQAIVSVVKSAHDKCYRASLGAGARVRPDGKTEEQWRTVLNQARDTLVDTQKRREYMETFLSDADTLEISVTDLPSPEIELENAEPTPESTHETISVLPLSNTDPVSVPPNLDVPDSMVFIPAGEFQMGEQDKAENTSEMPAQTIFMDAFLIDKYPVTNAQYKAFIEANPQWQKNTIVKDYHDGNYLNTWNGNTPPRGKADYPVVNVSWYAAMAYAQWTNKRLPTEAEWEKAARGGLVGKIYPWGDGIDINLANYGMQLGRTTPVGKYPPNDYGVYDMAGNVWEWCLDEHDGNTPRRHPGLMVDSIDEITTNFLHIATFRVLRGGSWASSERAAQVAYCGWAPPNFTYYSYGFRCVRAVTS